MGEVIQFIPRPNPNREKQLEQQAIEIMNVALMGAPGMPGSDPGVVSGAERFDRAMQELHGIPYGGQGNDGMDFDAACSEMNPDQSA